MSKKYLFTVIIVNEKYEIIDGQHRFECIKALKLPLNYIICKGYSLDEVHILNQNSKTWNSDDYVAGYSNLGYEDYILFNEFKLKYQLGHNETFVLLSGGFNRYRKSSIFNSGNFKIVDYDYAVETIEKISLIQPFYANYKRRSFIFAIITLLRNPDFDFDHFLDKVALQPTSLVDCVTIESYIKLIEEIYNYKKRHKVNLRFTTK